MSNSISHRSNSELERTDVIAPTIVMMTPAMAEMMALMPRPMAETIEPCGKQGQRAYANTGGSSYHDLV
jgi:hypothetical protein